MFHFEVFNNFLYSQSGFITPLTNLFFRLALSGILRLHESDPQLVLEFRPLSLQPSAFEDYAMIAFALGMLMNADARNESLLPLPLVHDNRWSAMLHGMDGLLWMMESESPVQAPARDVLKKQITRARYGMSVLGASTEEIAQVSEVWNQRLMDGTPSDVFFMRVRDAWMRRSAGNHPIDRALLRECLLAKKDLL